MCGILGIASTRAISQQQWLDSGSSNIYHRGPDDSGSWYSEDGLVGLAHRRLSIIDLSDNASQPMVDDVSGNAIVFNGEIYNHRQVRQELCEKNYSFKSNSDTEVILKAYLEWGVGCLDRLVGMFAFAIYDCAKKQIFVARDRAGEKPLFIIQSNGELRFASELKALLADRGLKREINTESLDCYLAMGFIPGERCILKGFQKLPPAHALIYDLNRGTCSVWQYWKLPDLDSRMISGQINESELLEELEFLLEQSISQQLVADVPVGVLLSGGVDSSLITALSARSQQKIKTFTVRFPGAGVLDETKHARLIAHHFGTEHIELEAEATSADLLPRLARQFDEPLVDSSMIPTFLVSQMVRQHCAVALGGDGGDELFGGYGHYSRLNWLQKRLGWLPRPLRIIVSKLAASALPLGFAGGNVRTWLQALGSDLKDGLPLIASYFDEVSRIQLFAYQSADWPICAERIEQARIPQAPDLLQRATRMDFTNYLAEDILVKVDRSSMLNSLEVRAPFLDHRLIEFAFQKVPSHLKATDSSKKILLKKLAARVLPKEFDMKRKQGFSIPLNDWLKEGTWRQLFYDVLLDPQCLFDSKMIATLLSGQAKGAGNGERLFGLVLFELWRREYAVTTLR